MQTLLSTCYPAKDCHLVLKLYAPGQQIFLLKENSEGRWPKSRDRHCGSGISNSLHPRSKLSRPSTDLISMISEVEIDY
jgi:hypothetical protein